MNSFWIASLLAVLLTSCVADDQSATRDKRGFDYMYYVLQKNNNQAEGATQTAGSGEAKSDTPPGWNGWVVWTDGGEPKMSKLPVDPKNGTVGWNGKPFVWSGVPFGWTGRPFGSGVWMGNQFGWTGGYGGHYQPIGPYQPFPVYYPGGYWPSGNYYPQYNRWWNYPYQPYHQYGSNYGHAQVHGNAL